jgi:succinoglycan biosynthesis protein ExoM
MLRALLESLSQLNLSPTAAPIHIVVVDNDAANSARAVVEAIRPLLPFPVHLETEPRRNIASARNRSVAMALALGAEHIAFIDDDERAEPDWLERLVAAKAAFGADVVAGPVIGKLPDRAPDWIRTAGFFNTADLAHGSVQEVASTSNLLVAATLLASIAGPFDERFGLSGGSDSFLFTRLARSGARIVWAADALLVEEIPLSRTTAKWLFLRSMRVGQTAVRCERALDPSLRRLRRRVLRGVGHLGFGLATLPVSLLRGRATIMRSLLRIAYGLGVLSALFLRPYREYRTIHGH